MSDYLYFHYLISDSSNINNTIKINTNLNLTVKEFLSNAQKEINSTSKNTLFKVISLTKSIKSKALSEDLPLKYFFNSGDDIFCNILIESIQPSSASQTATSNENKKEDTIDLTKATVKEDLTYKALSKYSFYDDGKYVKVIIPLNNVGKVKEEVKSEFNNRSFFVFIPNLDGSNYRFGVNKLHYEINKNESKTIVKANEILVKLHKAKIEDHWSYLYKVKMVGEDEFS